jgi:RHS repeat-associated protein
VLISTANFLYDGWNLVAELTPSGSLVRNYVWGTDLSGSQQGAGGVGGLLEVSYHGTATTNAFVAFDGNGNVTALVNAGDGTVVGNYEYGPFGEVIRATGPMAKANPIRFSTKYQDDESDMLYYGYRYYRASTGTWLSRYPLAEPGSRLLRSVRTTCYSALRRDVNSYLFCNDSALANYDALGLVTQDDCDQAYQNDLKKVQQAGSKCLGSALKWAIIGEVGFGGGGMIIGTVVGVYGAGIGLVLGTGVDAVVDICHWSHCNKEVKKMEQAAEKAHDDCLKTAD